MKILLIVILLLVGVLLQKILEKSKMIRTHGGQSSKMHTMICSTQNNTIRIEHMKKFIHENQLSDDCNFTWEHGLFVSKNSSEVSAITNNRQDHDFHDFNIELYVAHCLTYIKVLKWFVDSKYEKILKLEDDIIVAQDDINVVTHIESAPYFDVLVLEWCYGQCQNMSYENSDKRWAYNLDAHCTAAIVWTKVAAREFLRFVEQRKRLFNIDELTSQFFSTKAVTVVYSNPPIIIQDRSTFSDGMSENNGLDLCF